MSLIAAHVEADRVGWREEIGRLDVAVYAAVAATPTPGLDGYFRGVSRAADHSKLWIGSAAALAAAGGRPGQRAAVNGLASIAVSSAVVNLLLKPLSRRRRPDRRAKEDASFRHVAMPTGDWASNYRHRSPRSLLTGPHRRALPERRGRRISHRCGAGSGGRGRTRPPARPPNRTGD